MSKRKNKHYKNGNRRNGYPENASTVPSAPYVLECVVDDGTMEIPVKNKFGQEICRIHFRPSDLSIYDRYKKLKDDFGYIVEPLRDIDISNDGNAVHEADEERMKQVEQRLFDRINGLFDSDDASSIFSNRNPFSSVGGEFFCKNVIFALGSVVAQAIQYENKLIEEKAAQYLSDIEGADNAGDNT